MHLSPNGALLQTGLTKERGWLAALACRIVMGPAAVRGRWAADSTQGICTRLTV